MTQGSRALDGGLHEPVGFHEHGAKLVVGERTDRRPRGRANRPEGLGLPDVPDPGDEVLVEERVADPAIDRPFAQVGDHALDVGRLGQDVRAQRERALRVELQHGAVPEDRLVRPAAEDEPREAGARGAAPGDAPAARHAQVAPQDVSAFEGEKEVLADRVDPLESPSIEPFGDPLPAGSGIRSLDADVLADERLEALRGSVDAVAFRHGSSSPVPGLRNGVPANRRAWTAIRTSPGCGLARAARGGGANSPPTRTNQVHARVHPSQRVGLRSLPGTVSAGGLRVCANTAPITPRRSRAPPRLRRPPSAARAGGLLTQARRDAASAGYGTVKSVS